MDTRMSQFIGVDLPRLFQILLDVLPKGLTPEFWAALSAFVVALGGAIRLGFPTGKMNAVGGLFVALGEVFQDGKLSGVAEYLKLANALGRIFTA